MRHRIVCVNLASETSKLLAEELSIKLNYRVLRSLKTKDGRSNIIYGDQVDKLAQYEYFLKNGLNFPKFTKSKEEAIEMAQHGAVVCRTLLRSRSGKGIVIADKPEQVVDAPVYVAYHKKTNEYRVSLYRGEVVCIREKRLKKDYVAPEGRDGRVRSHDNGYVFCEPLAPLSEAAISMCKTASKMTKSDIVGVDIAYHKPSDYYFMLEVNSAPGMQGLTIEQFADAILKGGV
jgi:glutathione synthase/RimK-type ligase-like ATP-grasp enzyme